MKKVIILSIFSIFLGACASNEAVEVATEESIQYIDLTSVDKKDLITEYWREEKRQNPQYPIDAARKGLSGCVDFIVGINSDGRVGEYKIKNSYPKGVFDEYAAAALANWKWVATDMNSDNKPVLTSIKLDFMIGGSKNKTASENRCGYSHAL